MFCAEDESVTGLTANQWSIVKNVVKTLAPFQEITKVICISFASLSVIIPTVKALISFLNKDFHDAGIKTMKSPLLESVKSRFAKPHVLLVVATALDPRFKFVCFNYDEGESRSTITTSRGIAHSHVMMAIAKSSIPVEVSSASASVQNVTATSGSSATNTLDNTDEVDVPPAKKMTIFSCFDDMLVCADSSSNTSVIANEPNGTSELA